jgi:hypothetical protein
MENLEETYTQLLLLLRKWDEPIDNACLEYFAGLLGERRSNYANTFEKKIKSQIILEIEKIKSYDKISAGILEMRFFQKKSVVFTAQHFFFSIDQCNRKQKNTIERIVKSFLNQNNKISESKHQYFTKLNKIPIEKNVFGLNKIVENMLEIFLNHDSPQIVSIVGLGGIGKTTFASQIANKINQSEKFANVIWLQSEMVFANRKEKWTEDNEFDLINSLANIVNHKYEEIDPSKFLAEFQNDKRLFVILDNFDFKQGEEKFWELIGNLSPNIHWLVTTRNHPPFNGNIKVEILNEMSRSGAGELIEYTFEQIVQQSDISKINQYSGEIYDVVGGNPLAIKLLIGLLEIFTIKDVLKGLKVRNPGSIEDMYTHIYWEAWKGLSESQRSILLVMPLIAEEIGGTIDLLSNLSGETFERTVHDIEKLFHRSLVETRGNINIKRFGIHHLTKTFLHSNITNWDQPH